MLDDLFLGEPARRMVSGLALLLIGVLAWAWLARREHHGERRVLLDEPFAIAIVGAPIGLALVLSGVWGLLGVAAFTAAAIAVCGAGVVVLWLRGAF